MKILIILMEGFKIKREIEAFFIGFCFDYFVKRFFVDWVDWVLSFVRFKFIAGGMDRAWVVIKKKKKARCLEDSVDKYLKTEGVITNLIQSLQLTRSSIVDKKSNFIERRQQEKLRHPSSLENSFKQLPKKHYSKSPKNDSVTNNEKLNNIRNNKVFLPRSKSESKVQALTDLSQIPSKSTNVSTSNLSKKIISKITNNQTRQELLNTSTPKIQTRHSSLSTNSHSKLLSQDTQANQFKFSKKSSSKIPSNRSKKPKIMLKSRPNNKSLYNSVKKPSNDSLDKIYKENCKQISLNSLDSNKSLRQTRYYGNSKICDKAIERFKEVINVNIHEVRNIQRVVQCSKRNVNEKPKFVSKEVQTEDIPVKVNTNQHFNPIAVGMLSEFIRRSVNRSNTVVYPLKKLASIEPPNNLQEQQKILLFKNITELMKSQLLFENALKVIESNGDQLRPIIDRALYRIQLASCQNSRREERSNAQPKVPKRKASKNKYFKHPTSSSRSSGTSTPTSKDHTLSSHLDPSLTFDLHDRIANIYPLDFNNLPSASVLTPLNSSEISKWADGTDKGTILPPLSMHG